MTEGSGLYLAGPALVKAAIGQEVSDEELGGAQMHAAVSGTIDFKEKDDEACIGRLRSLMGKYGRETERLRDEETKWGTQAGAGAQSTEHSVSSSLSLSVSSARNPDDIYSIFTDKPGAQY